MNIGKEFLQIKLCACQGFGCESAGDTVNTVMVGWCGGTSSSPVSHARSRWLGHKFYSREEIAASNPVKHNHIFAALVNMDDECTLG